MHEGDVNFGEKDDFQHGGDNDKERKDFEYMRAQGLERSMSIDDFQHRDDDDEARGYYMCVETQRAKDEGQSKRMTFSRGRTAPTRKV